MKEASLVIALVALGVSLFTLGGVLARRWSRDR